MSVKKEFFNFDPLLIWPEIYANWSAIQQQQGGRTSNHSSVYEGEGSRGGPIQMVKHIGTFATKKADLGMSPVLVHMAGCRH